MAVDQKVTVDALNGFDSIIDVRSPAEFAEDHIPGAMSAPVLSNDERAHIGTLHKQASAFDAKKAGAALVARNIARHLEEHFGAQPKSWRPLIYCWRGGQRSGAMTEIFTRIGWRAAQLDGGYKAYRRSVIERLDALPGQLHYRIVCGVTGSGKSRLLRTLDAEGAQVLDLEELAQHRGSVLGNLPDAPQPSQKMFETRVLARLSGFDASRPVFVEAESKKVGNVRVPEALMVAMRAAPCLKVEMDVPLRVELLKEEYAHFLANPALLGSQLDCLTTLHGRERIADWKSLATAGEWDSLVERLLTEHYDPAYLRGMGRNYVGFGKATELTIKSIDGRRHARRGPTGDQVERSGNHLEAETGIVQGTTRGTIRFRHTGSVALFLQILGMHFHLGNLFQALEERGKIRLGLRSIDRHTEILALGDILLFWLGGFVDPINRITTGLQLHAYRNRGFHRCRHDRFQGVGAQALCLFT